MKRLIVVLWMLTILSTTSYAKYVALLAETASGGYINSDKDIETMKRLLGEKYKLTILREDQATSINIRAELVKAQGLKADDTFLFYFSGHGDRFYMGDEGERDGYDDFLVTSDMKCTERGAITHVLIDDELGYLYAQIPARKIIIIDACHSETMYKGISDNPYTKTSKECGSGIKKRGFPVDAKFSKAHADHIIYIAACHEDEKSEGSREGGIFTLAFAKAIKESGDVPLDKLIRETQKNIKPISMRLGATGAFVPVIKSNGWDTHDLYTKEIFSVAPTKPIASLKTLLEQQPQTINLRLHNDKHRFDYGERIVLKALIPDTPAYIYLIDMLDQNSYKLLSSIKRSHCISLPDSDMRQCQFENLVGSTPFGQSNLYIIVSPKSLSMQHTKDIIVRPKASLERGLTNGTLKIGKVSFEVYPR